MANNYQYDYINNIDGYSLHNYTMLHRAMAHRLDLTSVMSAPLHQLVSANSDAIGCPPELIFYPLLTSTAKFKGTNASIKINSEWQEPAVDCECDLLNIVEGKR